MEPRLYRNKSKNGEKTLISQDKLRNELTKCILFFSSIGWVPATSSNFSVRLNKKEILISRSGVDKSNFQNDDIITIDRNGTVLNPIGERASAETLIHCTLYNHFPEVQCVLHTHSINGTVISRMSKNELSFTGFEVQKALSGVSTHSDTINIPILENDQDMSAFCKRLKACLQQQESIQAFLIRGHGLYTWGKNIAEAKKSIEALEFVMECLLLERRTK
jgi:methylthioribulose-1-phosphate dehydratase